MKDHIVWDVGKRTILSIGAHPDDAEFHCSGTLAKFHQMGDRVILLSVTDGSAGHFRQTREVLRQRRKQEATKAAEIIDGESMCMGCIDGELVPSLDVRNKLIGVIRAIQPDVILTHRMNDYHPDHRYTSQLVQDASFLLQVPNVVEKVPALKYSPVILYWRDKFEKPYPFEPDIVINIDDTFGIKLQMLGQHESQIFEWLPWISGFYQKIPQDLDPQTRQQWVKKIYEMLVPSSIPMEYQKLLISRYGEREGKGTKEIEAFALSEYGYRVGRSQLQVLFAGC